MPTDVTHHIVEANGINGIRMHIAEQGTGPTVLLCHGFPELWYSWRHQLSALAAAGRRTSVMPQTEGAIWYQLYFQERGVAEAEYDRNVRAVFHAGRIGISGEAPPGTRPFGMVQRRGSPFRWNVEPPPLPAW